MSIMLSEKKFVKIFLSQTPRNFRGVYETIFVVSKTAEDESDEDEAPPPPLVTVKEVHSAMQTVLRFEEQANSESNIRSEELHFLRKLHKQYQREYEKLKKQTSIREFFNNEN